MIDFFSFIFVQKEFEVVSKVFHFGPEAKSYSAKRKYNGKFNTNYKEPKRIKLRSVYKS